MATRLRERHVKPRRFFLGFIRAAVVNRSRLLFVVIERLLFLLKARVRVSLGRGGGAGARKLARDGTGVVVGLACLLCADVRSTSKSDEDGLIIEGDMNA